MKRGGTVSGFAYSGRLNTAASYCSMKVRTYCQADGFGEERSTWHCQIQGVSRPWKCLTSGKGCGSCTITTSQSSMCVLMELSNATCSKISFSPSHTAL